jgi:hypothetical protein
MTKPPGDDRLERLFAEMRAAERGHASPFDRVWARVEARAARRRPRRAAWWGASAALAAAGVALLLLTGRSESEVELAASLMAWRSPTEFLLSLPGEEMIRTVPSVATSFVRLQAFGPETTIQ